MIYSKGKHSKPKLRFSQFESEWDQAKMHTLTSVLRCGIAATPTYVEEGVPFLSAQNVSRTGNINLNKYSFISEDYYRKLSKNHSLKKGDILYSRVGATYGNAAIFPYEGDFGVYVSLTHIRTREGISNSYMKYFLNSPYGKRQAFKGVFQGGGVPNLNVKVVEKFDVTYPSLPEQQKIAVFLSAVDKKLQLLQRKKELLEQYKKGVMQKLFSQEIRFKDEDGKDYPDWEEKYLGDILSIGSGRDYKHLGKGNVPVFGTGGYMLSVDKPLYSGESVFIGRKGTIDKPFYYEGDFWTVDTLFYTHQFNGIIPKFVFLIFQMINWKSHNEASGVPSLSKSTIERILVNIPHYQEQMKIALFVFSLDEKIKSLDTQLLTAQQFKKGLLQQMFV